MTPAGLALVHPAAFAIRPGEGRGTLRSEAYEASDGQRSTSLPASAAEVTFPCESRVAFP